MAGKIDPGDADVAAWNITQLSLATFHHYAFATPPVSLTEVADELWSFCLRALGGPPGRS